MQIYGPSQIHGAQPINGPHTTRGVQGAATPASTASAGDRLDISEAGQLAGRMAEIPEMRADRVRDIRSAIVNGTYETEGKLNTALDRLLDEIA
jgi:anti-sigma28 factor (negative regulator of flagellin synthesis)